MEDLQSISAIESAVYRNGFIRPSYESYNFARIPATIESLFSGRYTEKCLPASVFAGEYKKYSKVVFLFIDSFGWRFYQKFKSEFPALRRFLEKGRSAKLSAQFPSTTAAHVTTTHSGLPVYLSGIYEWFYFEPKIGSIIAPLIYSYADNQSRDSLLAAGHAAEDIFKFQSIYEKLKSLGVESYVFQSKEYAYSAYSKALVREAQICPFAGLKQGLNRMADKISQVNSQAYFFFYYDKIDSTCHLHGPDSRELETKMEYFFDSLEEFFFKKLENKIPDTLVIFSADHGQVQVNPQTTIYIDREIKQIRKSIKPGKRDNEILAPAGSARDLFLHVKEEALDGLHSNLQELLLNKAQVFKTSQLLDEGIFGSNPSNLLKERLGNLVILPLEGESVWWSEGGKYKMNFKGHHGGLTRNEMEIPFLLLEI